MKPEADLKMSAFGEGPRRLQMEIVLQNQTVEVLWRSVTRSS